MVQPPAGSGPRGVTGGLTAGQGRYGGGGLRRGAGGRGGGGMRGLLTAAGGGQEREGAAGGAPAGLGTGHRERPR
ncbi:hypothetical protein GCM10018781_27400 [Kitasatospora indigofera]|uniref:Uncharacterized protein n=1 Tax=Kitasatospora indigofera TaxID=67307 RepID=A0A919FN22_9ACTN|nr:hypothetical protein GCM10018781_27400 [Kitasatospora indigofera]